MLKPWCTRTRLPKQLLLSANLDIDINEKLVHTIVKPNALLPCHLSIL